MSVTLTADERRHLSNMVLGPLTEDHATRIRQVMSDIVEHRGPQCTCSLCEKGYVYRDYSVEGQRDAEQQNQGART